MRKWLFFLLIIAALYAVTKINKNKAGKKSPVLKQISDAITYLVWILLTAYVIFFLYWIYSLIFPKP